MSMLLIVFFKLNMELLRFCTGLALIVFLKLDIELLRFCTGLAGDLA